MINTPPGPTRAASPWGTTTPTGSALYALARRYVLADQFFQGAFGGSFLNHQYLICACAPRVSQCGLGAGETLDRDTRARCRGPLSAATEDRPDSPASALDGPPRFARSGNIAPDNYFGDGKFHAVNTMQPAFQPSGNGPAAGDTSGLYADPALATTLPPQNAPTIGDRLSAKNIGWAWYAGAWDAAIEDGRAAAGDGPPVIYAPQTAPAAAPTSSPITSPSTITRISIRP